MTTDEFRARVRAEYEAMTYDDLIREGHSMPSPWNRAGSNPENFTPAKIAARRIRREVLDEVLEAKHAEHLAAWKDARR